MPFMQKCEYTRQALEQCDIAHDIKEFIQKRKTGSIKPRMAEEKPLYLMIWVHCVFVISSAAIEYENYYASSKPSPQATPPPSLSSSSSSTSLHQPAPKYARTQPVTVQSRASMPVFSTQHAISATAPTHQPPPPTTQRAETSPPKRAASGVNVVLSTSSDSN